MVTMTIHQAVQSAINSANEFEIPSTDAFIERLEKCGYSVVSTENVQWLLDRVNCTSDDPHNHQGDTCPVHEAPLGGIEQYQDEDR